MPEQKSQNEVVDLFEQALFKKIQENAPQDENFAEPVQRYVAHGLRNVIAQTVQLAMDTYKPRDQRKAVDVETQSTVKWALHMEQEWRLGGTPGSGGTTPGRPAPPQDAPQTAAEYTALVAQARAGYPARLSDRQAWEVTNLAAKLIRQKTGDDGWGLHRKGGRNVDGYAVDIIAHKSGRMYDVLGASGNFGPSNPQWLRVYGKLDWAPPV